MKSMKISTVLFAASLLGGACTSAEVDTGMQRPSASHTVSAPQRPVAVRTSLTARRPLPSQPPAEFQHDPYAEKECQGCHSSNRPSKRDVSGEIPDMCYDCHDEHTAKFLHAPVSVGECLVCHNPHKSKYKFLLIKKIPDLCFQCHERIQNIMTQERYVKHSPAVDSCVSCHNPHESDSSDKFLLKDIKTLCTECHIEKNVAIEKYIAKVTHKHKPIEGDERCARCHNPHASPFEFHLRAEPMDLCLKCHNEEIQAYDGKMLTDMAKLLKNNPSWHGPIREKNCTGCHNPHGSNHFRILKKKYPKEFYTDTFSFDNYQLCFSCHESTLLRDRETTTLTNFREGKRNLHFLHVNRPEKGRTCRACHETHASTHPKHIRDAVPFGKIQWPLKLKYQVDYADVNTGKSCDAESNTCVRTGGSCVGCHTRRHYNYRKSIGEKGKYVR